MTNCKISFTSEYMYISDHRTNVWWAYIDMDYTVQTVWCPRLWSAPVHFQFLYKAVFRYVNDRKLNLRGNLLITRLNTCFPRCTLISCDLKTAHYVCTVVRLVRNFSFKVVQIHRFVSKIHKPHSCSGLTLSPSPHCPLAGPLYTKKL